MLGRGSREPCGSKFIVSERRIFMLGRGSREPCGSKYLPEPVRLPPAGSSRLARALWIEIGSGIGTGS